jgi:hypothetical protein
MFGGGQDECAHVAVSGSEGVVQTVAFEGGFGDGALRADGDSLQIRCAGVLAGDAEEVFHLGLTGYQEGVDLVFLKGVKEVQDWGGIDRSIPRVGRHFEDRCTTD